MYVLHLLQPCGTGMKRASSSDAASLWCAALASPRAADPGHRVVMIGADKARGRAEALGVRIDSGVSPPLGYLPAARGRLRNTVAAWGRPLAVHAWSVGLTPLALHAASLFGVPAAVVDFPRGEITLHHTRPEGPATFSVPLPDSSLPSPPLSPREALRLSLNISPDEVVLCAADDPPDMAQARTLCDAVGILHVAGVRITILASTLTPALHVLHRHATGGYLRRLLITDRPLASLATAVDLAVLTSDWNAASGSVAGIMAASGARLVSCAPEAARLGATPARSTRGAHLASGCIEALDTPRHTTPPSLPAVDVAFWRSLWSGHAGVPCSQTPLPTPGALHV
ncbi:MAG: hypothetical protein KF859_00580 [Phycisphaeraceae bacterium]|nr:hypothetical protein [Phycisphaeraceae bacterium]